MSRNGRKDKVISGRNEKQFKWRSISIIDPSDSSLMSRCFSRLLDIPPVSQSSPSGTHTATVHTLFSTLSLSICREKTKQKTWERKVRFRYIWGWREGFPKWVTTMFSVDEKREWLGTDARNRTSNMLHINCFWYETTRKNIASKSCGAH